MQQENKPIWTKIYDVFVEDAGFNAAKHDGILQSYLKSIRDLISDTWSAEDELRHLAICEKLTSLTDKEKKIGVVKQLMSYWKNDVISSDTCANEIYNHINKT